MTEEEIKAEELIEMFGHPVKCKVTDKINLPISMHMEQQINAAIIAVEEILNFQDIMLEEFPSIGYEPVFWKKVLEVLKNKTQT